MHIYAGTYLSTPDEIGTRYVRRYGPAAELHACVRNTATVQGKAVGCPCRASPPPFDLLDRSFTHVSV